MFRCLLVTGDKAVRDIVKVGLEQVGGFAVDTAEDAWAFEMVRAKTYQLVVADTTLADGGDGMELLRTVRETLPDAELLLVCRDAADRAAKARDKAEFSVYSFLAHPIDAGDFFKTIARLVDRFSTRPAAAAA